LALCIGYAGDWEENISSKTLSWLYYGLNGESASKRGFRVLNWWFKFTLLLKHTMLTAQRDSFSPVTMQSD